MLVIVDYGMGNVGSVLKIFGRLRVPAEVSSDKGIIAKATKLVLPGVGHFAQAMKNLESAHLIPLLNERVLEAKTPILGICLGMQLMTEFSEEGDCAGLGWFKSRTVKFKPDPTLKVPHVGWNLVRPTAPPLFNGLGPDPRFYFTHSYRVSADFPEEVAAYTEYGGEFASAIGKDHLFGTQFHPEKSHQAGVQLIKNFVERG